MKPNTLIGFNLVSDKCEQLQESLGLKYSIKNTNVTTTTKISDAINKTQNTHPVCWDTSKSPLTSMLVIERENHGEESRSRSTNFSLLIVFLDSTQGSTGAGKQTGRGTSRLHD